MISKSNNDDIIGQIEDVFDQKIAQVPILSKEEIEEIIAEAKIEPVETNVYLKKSEAESTYATLEQFTNVSNNFVNYYVKTEIDDKITKIGLKVFKK